MPLGRHLILIYSLGDKKPAEKTATIRGEVLILKKVVVQLLSSESKKTTMKYSKERPTVFVPYQYDDITIENIKEACRTFFPQTPPLRYL